MLRPTENLRIVIDSVCVESLDFDDLCALVDKGRQAQSNSENCSISIHQRCEEGDPYSHRGDNGDWTYGTTQNIYLDLVKVIPNPSYETEMAAYKAHLASEKKKDGERRQRQKERDAEYKQQQIEKLANQLPREEKRLARIKERILITSNQDFLLLLKKEQEECEKKIITLRGTHHQSG